MDDKAGNLQPGEMLMINGATGGLGSAGIAIPANMTFLALRKNANPNNEILKRAEAQVGNLRNNSVD